MRWRHGGASGPAIGWAAWLVLASCAGEPALPVPDAALEVGGALDAPRADAPALAPDAPAGDAPAPTDAAPSDPLAAHRGRLVATMGEPCATWSSLDESARAVFLTLTHRLFLSATPDGSTMLAHVTRVYAVLGGGSSGTTCGGIDNNRLFVAVDAYLHGLLVETWNDLTSIADGGGSTWIPTRDLAGPHDPFDASVETDSGLRCVLVFEQSGSRPPTGQAHFFEGAPVAFVRSGVSLPADPFMLELDHDFNCTHDSNPTCRDFEDRYRRSYGDFACDWVPGTCAPTTPNGCYRDVAAP